MMSLLPHGKNLIMKIRKKSEIQNKEQIFSKNRYEAVENLAREAGFDDDAFAYTEFFLMSFFEIVVEHCAKVAEEHAVNYSGDGNESRGCKDAALAIRNFGKMVGNYEERKSVIGKKDE